MGMFSFIKEAGEKIFGLGAAKAPEGAAAAASSPEQIEALVRLLLTQLKPTLARKT